jgi:hypothetical protein
MVIPDPRRRRAKGSLRLRSMCPQNCDQPHHHYPYKEESEFAEFHKILF